MKICIPNSAELEQIFLLREREYKKKYLLKNSDFLFSDSYDLSDITLCVKKDDKEIISSMRGGIILNKNLLSERDIILDNESLIKMSFPILFLSRGVTDSKYGGTALNSILRIEFIKLAHKLKLESVTGVVYDTKNRLTSLNKIGYLNCLTINKHTNIVSPSRRCFVYLEKQKYNQAILFLEKKYKNQIPNYEVSFSLSKIKERLHL